jgi:PAS domain S-box-containing protein
MIEGLRALGCLLREPLLALDADGVVVHANAALAELLGQPVEALVGAPFAPYLAANPDGFQAYLRTCLRGGGAAPGRLTLRAGPEGSLRLRCTGTAFRSGCSGDGPAALIRLEPVEQAGSVFLELNARLDKLTAGYRELEDEKQQLELRVEHRTAALRARTAELEESEARIRAVLETAVDGVFTLDDQGIIESLNPAAEQIFGYSAAEAIGLPIGALVPAVDRSGTALHALQGKDADQNDPRYHELAARRRDGSKVPIELALTEVRLTDRVIVSGIARDVTARHLASAQVDALTKQLLDASRQAGMAEIATGVLHNVGNVLNSVNISTGIVSEGIRKSKAASLARVVAMLDEHVDDLGRFLTEDETGRRIPGYLAELSRHLDAERTRLLDELGALTASVEHIKTIVSLQHSYVGAAGLTETATVQDVLEDALRINSAALERHSVTVVRNYQDLPAIRLDRHRLLQIFVNLIRNAKHAITDYDTEERVLTASVLSQDPQFIDVIIADTGIGVAPEIADKIFAHGFTTRKSGHGFGLHHSANAAKEMGASISVHSDGPGTGATFTVRIPMAAGEAAA